jgi:hypothetical protein
MTSLRTHVLDPTVDRPAAGVPVTLTGQGAALLAGAVTDNDGRVADLYTANSSGPTGSISTPPPTSPRTASRPSTQRWSLPSDSRSCKPLPRSTAAVPIRLFHMPRELRSVRDHPGQE